MRHILRGSLWGISTVVLIFVIGLSIPGVGPVADALLAPGDALPKAYWGGVHDPFQILPAVLLNVMFYSLLFATWFWLSSKKRRLKQSSQEER